MNRSETLEAAYEVQNSMMHMWKQYFTSMLQQEGITHSQMMALMLISEHQPIMGKALAAHMLQTPSAVTQVIDSMADSGLVVREQDAADRRIVRLRLSPTGEDLVARIKDKRKELFFRSTEALTDDELHAHLAFQQKALAHLKEYIAKHTV